MHAVTQCLPAGNREGIVKLCMWLTDGTMDTGNGNLNCRIGDTSDYCIITMTARILSI